MNIKRSEYIQQMVEKNLITALQVTADAGDSKGAIRLSRYLLKLFNERNDKVIQLSYKQEK